MTSSEQPYRGRHSVPDAEPTAYPPGDHSAAAYPPAAYSPVEYPPVAALAPQQVTPWAAYVPEPASQPVQDWVAYSPPQQPSGWDSSAPYVPFPTPPRRSHGARNLAMLLVLVVAGALGWFGYHVISHHSSTSNPTVAADGTGTYTSTDGHFTVVMAGGHPEIVTQSTTVNGFTLSLTMAVDPAVQEGVGGVTITPAASSSQTAAMLRGFVEGLQRGGTVSDVTQGTYEGHPSVTATVTKSTGVAESVMAFTYSSTRMYTLFAPNGSALTVVERNFQPTP